MKEIIITLILLLIVLCPETQADNQIERTRLSPKKIMVHYMPWYQSKPYQGSWGWHWHMDSFSPPDSIASHYKSILGAYDSADPNVLASQVLVMKFAGIDGAIIDWYGIDDFRDYGLLRDAADKFVKYARKGGLKFCICYEDQTAKHMLDSGHLGSRSKAVAHGKAVMDWLQDNYFSDSHYLKHDGRPVLLCFGPQFFSSSEWESLFSELSPSPVFLTLHYHEAPKSGEFDWPVPAKGTERVAHNLSLFYNRAISQGWEYYGGVAFPRFHDIYKQAGRSSYGYIDSQGVNTYTMTLETGLKSKADLVQIVTWNDYGEGTNIEPTEEDGYTFLESTQHLRKKYLEPGFANTPKDLALPVRLYQLRKRHQKDRLLLGQLDAAEDKLFSNDLAGAKELLDQVDAKNQAAAESKQ
jgi:hypothetical protein